MSTKERSLETAGRAGSWAGALGMMILLAEVVWMVLPFVGFISLHVTLDPFFRFRRRWFQPFFMPSYNPVGAPLVLVGSGLFLTGAIQIYGRKLTGGGAVTGGLYRWVRHPQYTALIVVGFGLLLLWPRYYLLLAFVTMCFLYYALARNEERNMLRAHGDSYRTYLARTSAFVPGDRRCIGLSEPGPITVSGMLKGIVLWVGALILAFMAGVGISAYTITHRDLPTFMSNGFVAFERRVVYKDNLSRSEHIIEFFGKRRLGAQLRREENVREMLEASLDLLAEDDRIQRNLNNLQEPFIVAAVPLNPERSLFKKERRVADKKHRHLYRIYLIVLAGDGDKSESGKTVFNGYLVDKEKKLLFSALVNPVEKRLLQVVRLEFSERFVDWFDRLLDKETF